MTTGVCGQCGTPVEDGALFCSKCGVDVTGVQPDPDATLEATAVGGDAAPPGPTRSTMRQALREATLGEYEILNELGRGGMATVFLAHDISLDRRVAIKVMSPHLLEGAGMAERFKLEARTAAQLSHPHIIPIYAVKETANTLYFVMKYVEGRELGDIIKKSGQLPIATVRDILAKVGSALGYAHRRDVVHRDIKPGNIMIDDEGTPVVTDFGIAKVSETSGLTQTGSTIGTPSYMSPEQCEAKEVTGASDQYSLGVVAFEMLTGTLPFEGGSPVTVMYKHVHEDLPPLQDFRPDCPPELIETVSRMLAKKPEDRWPTMEAVIQKLGDGLDTMDPVRSQLIALAKQSGGSDELIRKLSDPSLAATAARSGPQTVESEAGGSRRKAMAGVGALLLLATVGALAVAQPWAAGDATPGEGAEAVATQPSTEPAAGDDAAATEDGPEDGDTPLQTALDDPVQEGDEASGETPADDAPADPDETPTDAGPTEPTPEQPRQITVASVSVQGGGSLIPGGQSRLTAIAIDGTGARVAASTVENCDVHGWTRCGTLWTSSDPGVAEVRADGTVVAVGPGRATISAEIGGRRGTADIEVGEVPVASVEIVGGDLTLAVGTRQALRARVLGQNGSELSGRTIQWAVDASSVARIGADGSLETTAPGTTTVRASVEGVEGTVGLTVEAPSAASAVQGLLDDYERAFESGDLDAVSAVVTGLSQQMRQRVADTFEFMSDIDAVMGAVSLDDRGDEATAEVDAVYRFVAEGERLETSVTLVFELRRTNGVWRIDTMDSR